LKNILLSCGKLRNEEYPPQLWVRDWRVFFSASKKLGLKNILLCCGKVRIE
jgi:hypothetical protein